MTGPARIGVALSGGGFRAAAFHLGVLRGLKRAGLLQRVEVVSAVSGGALLAAAWAAYGAEDFEALERRLRRFLGRDLKRRVLVAALRPDRLARLLFSPAYSLTETMAAVLARDLLGARTLGSLRDRRPRLVVNATCVNHGTGWRFTPDRIGDWILKTSDRDTLDAFPLARAVAASAAFPGGLAPLVLRGADVFPAASDPPREILLTDGGVDDNLGLQALVAEECDALVVSDASFPFERDDRPLDRFGLPPGRRVLLSGALLALASWAAARLDLPAAALALLGAFVVAILLRLRFALWLFGSVMMRGQRRGLLRGLFAVSATVPTAYVGLGSRLSPQAEAALRALGLDVARLRRVRTDLTLMRDELDGLIALGETAAVERIAQEYDRWRPAPPAGETNAMSQDDAPVYVGPTEIRGASIVGVFRDEATLRVVLKSRGGLGLTLTFRDVTGVVERRAQGMTLAGLTRSAGAGQQQYVFANATPKDGATLEVSAGTFEVGSSP